MEISTATQSEEKRGRGGLAAGLKALEKGDQGTTGNAHHHQHEVKNRPVQVWLLLGGWLCETMETEII